MIGIIAALKDEVRDIKNNMTQVETSEKAGMTFYKGMLYGKLVVAVMCGVGKVNAALCTQALADLFNVDCVINVGVGGAVAKGLTVGDIVISKDSVQYDMDASAFGHPRGEIPNMDMTFFPADERLIELAKEAAAKVGAAALVGRVMTADLGVDSQALKQELTELFGGTPQMCLGAAANALSNLLGLVCDPIAGLVEAPCQKRNAIGASNAIISAEIALSGVENLIPFDEAVSAMLQVGRRLPPELRETALGGMAATPTGCVLCKRIYRGQDEEERE